MEKESPIFDGLIGMLMVLGFAIVWKVKTYALIEFTYFAIGTLFFCYVINIIMHLFRLSDRTRFLISLPLWWLFFIAVGYLG